MVKEFFTSDKSFSEMENSVLEYLKLHKSNLKQLTIQKVADETYTSKSTIFRLSKKLGFEGFTDMIYHLSKQDVNVENRDLDTYIKGINEDVKNIFIQNEKALAQFSQMIKENKSALYVIGTGYSGILGEYFYKKVLGKGELVYYANGADSNTLFINNLHRISQIICISKSGETALVNNKAMIAKEQGKGVISFTHSSDNTLAKQSDIAFIVDDNQFLDSNNVYSTHFYSLLFLYLEYVIEESFK
ncbi:MurR/RpiR family transcriptional regulator [Aerococcus urinaeequi]|uniref:MurR/RpiR family transcriptional regulator n=1 Tax=Aerococcus urinaeequi TaxID=51665 RepID=UPI003D6C236E